MIGFYVAFGVMDAILLTVLVSLPGRWIGKAAFIGAAWCANLALLGAVPDTAGYAKHGVPDQAKFISCYVDEPTYVYLWVLEDRPRAYRLPYDRETHRACEQAKQAAASGVLVGIKARKGKPGHGYRGQFHPYVLPPEGAPKKESP